MKKTIAVIMAMLLLIAAAQVWAEGFEDFTHPIGEKTVNRVEFPGGWTTTENFQYNDYYTYTYTITQVQTGDNMIEEIRSFVSELGGEKYINITYEKKVHVVKDLCNDDFLGYLDPLHCRNVSTWKTVCRVINDNGNTTEYGQCQ